MLIVENNVIVADGDFAAPLHITGRGVTVRNCRISGRLTREQARDFYETDEDPTAIRAAFDG